MNNDLKPCPFCGEDDLLDIRWIVLANHNEYVVWCKNCSGQGPNDVSSDRAQEMWNLRRTEETSTLKEK